jgi:hypothetical protein
VGSPQAQGLTYGVTDSAMMVSGCLASSTALECGEASEGTHTRESGSTANQMATESTHGPTETPTKESSRNASNTDKAYKGSRTETCTRVAMLMASHRGMGSISGSMEAFLRESSETVSGRGEECGGEELGRLTGTRESTRATRSGEKAYLRGRVGTSTRGAMRPICGMDTDRCTGRMAATTRDNGPMESSMAKVQLIGCRIDVHPEGGLQERNIRQQPNSLSLGGKNAEVCSQDQD